MHIFLKNVVVHPREMIEEASEHFTITNYIVMSP